MEEKNARALKPRTQEFPSRTSSEETWPRDVCRSFVSEKKNLIFDEVWKKSFLYDVTADFKLNENAISFLYVRMLISRSSLVDIFVFTWKQRDAETTQNRRLAYANKGNTLDSRPLKRNYTIVNCRRIRLPFRRAHKVANT